MYNKFAKLLLLAMFIIMATMTVSGQDDQIVLRFPITSDPASLEPGLVKELYAGQIALNLHAGLFTYDIDTQIVPYLVSEYEVSEDETVYTFHLREDATWHNGRAVMASDFVMGWERYLDQEIGSQAAGEPFFDIVGAEALWNGEADTLEGAVALDEHTLQVTLVGPSLIFLQTLAVPITWVVPSEALVEGSPQWVDNPVGAGPFRFVEWQPNVKIVLEANDDFFLGRPEVDIIEFVVVPDANTALAQFEAGELDIVAVPASDLERVTNDSELGEQIHYFTRAQLRYAGMNQSMFEPFQDVRVRQAFNYAINRGIIVHNILNDSWTVATGLVPPNIPEYNPDLAGYDYNPDMAQELLADAGYPNGEGFPTVEFATLDSTTAEAIAAMLSTNLNITVEIIQPERGDMIGGLWDHDRWQMFLFGWTADSPSASVWTYELLVCELDSNFSTYCNADVDDFVLQAQEATDFETAKAAWQQAEVVAMEDAALIPLGYSRYIYMVNPEITGFAANLFGPMGFDLVTVSE